MPNILIDCDPGHDDAIALLLAAHTPELRILAVTTVAGNTTLDCATRNALRVLHVAGADDVPVYPGCGRPMLHPLPRLAGAAVHGQDGLGGALIPDAPRPAERVHAVEQIIRVLRGSAEKLTLVALGPLTNIALALRLAPDIIRRVDRLVVMGGAVREPGNINSAAEFNMYVDPEAAHMILHAGWPLYLVPLDVTMKALFREADIAALEQGGTASSLLAAQLLRLYGGRHAGQFDEDGLVCPIHDALCVGCVIDPRLVTFAPAYCDVSLYGITRGETVVQRGASPNVFLAETVNAPAFVTLITQTLSFSFTEKRKKQRENDSISQD